MSHAQASEKREGERAGAARDGARRGSNGGRGGARRAGRPRAGSSLVVFEQQPCERHAALLAAGEDRTLGIVWRAAECLRGAVDNSIELPEVPGVDLLLHRAKLVHHCLHLVIVEGLAHLCAQVLKLLEQRPAALDSLLEALADRLALELRLLRQVAD
eukprot:6952820-Prymnesium_polylepis.2